MNKEMIEQQIKSLEATIEVLKLELERKKEMMKEKK